MDRLLSEGKMSTKSKFVNGTLRFFDGKTFETVDQLSPITFQDDFLGAGILSAPAAFPMLINDVGTPVSGNPYVQKMYGAAPPTILGVAGTVNGIIEFTLTSDSQKQEATLCFGDKLHFSLLQGLVFECRVKVPVLPTGNGKLSFGVGSAVADGPNAASFYAHFALNASGVVYAEMKDGATTTSTSTGITVNTTDWNYFHFSFGNSAKPVFKINGNDVFTGPAWAASAANSLVQLYISAYKASGTGLGQMDVDFVKLYQNRS